jgi:hypothetical protein
VLLLGGEQLLPGFQPLFAGHDLGKRHRTSFGPAGGLRAPLRR